MIREQKKRSAEIIFMQRSSKSWVVWGGRAQVCVLLGRWCMGGEEDDAKTGALS
jgi:hypothetical protein